MPCNSDYLQADNFEIKMSRVAALLDEIEHGIPVSNKNWDGYHPKVYCRNLSKKECDAMVASLCAKLRQVDVTKYSLEMQIWWRDHQKADAARLGKDLV